MKGSRLIGPSLLLALLASNAEGADPQPLGRLFFTPAERTKLDARRQEAILNANRPAPTPVAESPKLPQSQILTLNGVVRRSDGESTVWINGKALDRRSDPSGAAPAASGGEAAGVSLPGSGRRVRLKVGQSVESLSGVIEESYRRRATLPVATAHETAPKPASPTGAESGPDSVESSQTPAAPARE